MDLGLDLLHRVRIRVRLGLESHGLVENRIEYIMMDCIIGMQLHFHDLVKNRFHH